MLLGSGSASAPMMWSGAGGPGKWETAWPPHTPLSAFIKHMSTGWPHRLAPDPETALPVPPSHQRPKPQRPVAVALKYEAGKQSLPKVVATGRGTLAEQILELAFANGVKVREDSDLVEILSAIELDSEIPVEAIVAVAEILAHVYRANGTLPPPQPARGDAA